MRTTHMFGMFALAGAVAFAVGCSSDAETDDGAGGAGGAGSGAAGPGPTSTTGTGTTTSSTGTGVVDESTSCDDAVVMDERMNQDNLPFNDGSGVLNPGGDEDFFKFTATAGDWIGLFTDANPDDDPMMVDTVLTLYDESGNTMLAEVDDAFPRATTDSEMFYRVTATGTYCLKVQEFSSWAGQSPEGDPSFAYRAIVLPIDFNVYEQYNLDTGANDTQPEAQATTATALTNGQDFGTLAGVLDPGTDVDWYEVTTPAAAQAMSLDLTPMGNDGFGSTQGPGLIQLVDTNGTTVLGQVDNAEQPNGLDGMSSVVVAESSTYFLRVVRPVGNTTVGANDFYFLKFFTQDALNPQEIEPNNGSGTATAALPQATPNAMDQTHRSWFVGGTLDGTPDWWTLRADTGQNIPEPQSGEVLTVACSSWAAGSGVRNMVVNFHDAMNSGNDKALIQEDKAKGILATNSATPGSTEAGISLMSTGTDNYQIEITADSFDGTVMSRHYLCGFHVGST